MRVLRSVSLGFGIFSILNSTIRAATDASIQELLAKERGIASVQFDYTYADFFNGTPVMGTYKGTIWQKGPRKKITIGGGMFGANQMTLTSGPEGSFFCSESTNQCSQQSGIMFPLSLDNLLKSNPQLKTTIVGTETIEGKACTVVKASLDVPVSGAMTSKQWIWNDHGIPLRIEQTAAMAADHISRMDIHNVVLKPLPDTLFAVSKDRLQPPSSSGINSVVISPRVIPVDKPTRVHITITMEPGSTKPESVSLIEVGPKQAVRKLTGLEEGKKNIVPNVIEKEITLKEKTQRTMHLQVIVKEAGKSQEVISPLQDVIVQDSHAPDRMLQQLAKELEDGDLQAVQQHFMPDGKNVSVFQQLPPDQRKELAQFFRGLHQAKATDTYLLYKGLMKIPNGETDEEVMLALDMQGQWVIEQW